MNKYSNYLWSNHIRDQQCTATLAFDPSEIDQIRSIIISAENENKKVRAVGSGHSWSNVCLNNDFLILPDGLKGEIPLESDLLNANVDNQNLVRVKSGTRIRELNELLDKKGLALPYLGGFDGQTIVGVNATSTHGSVIKCGPIYETILSYDIVGSEGKVYRVENKEGITNATKYKSAYPNRTLIQDDQYYNAVSVNLGCLGVIYSVILKTVPSFYLKEQRPLSTWEIEKGNLLTRKYLDTQFHFELLINPYQVNGQRLCLNTFRTKIVPSGNESIKDRSRNFPVEFLSWLNKKGIFNTIIGWFKKDAGNMVNNILRLMKDKEFIGKSYMVFHIGEANYVPSYSAEVALPMKNEIYIAAIEKMFEIIERLKHEKKMYFTGPIAIRFVRNAQAYLSPMFGDDTCMVELILPKGAENYKEIYIAIEKALIPFGARMHWGQLNFINSTEVASMYPKINLWKEVRNVLNKTGVFNNKFSSQMGLNS